MRTRIKFCGCGSIRDAELAVEAGVDAVGVIFAESSPRRVSMETAREIAAAIPPYVQLVAVFVDPTAALVDEALKSGYIPQFSGNESAGTAEAFAAGPYLKVYHIPSDGAPSRETFDLFAHDYAHATWMFEPKVAGMDGGTGTTFRWDIARTLAGNRRIVMSGGLTPQNVGDCIRRVRPYGVDVRSGIESGDVKDAEKMRAFVNAVKEADAQA